MNHENEFREMGHELGHEGVERLVDYFEEIRAQERRRIELTNEGPIAGLQAELAMWADEDTRIGEQLRLARPPGDKRSRWIRAWFAGIVVVILTVAEFFFSLLAFDPFRFGWKSFLYCIGIAAVAPFCIDRLLEEWNCRRVLRWLATIAAIAAVTSLVSLALVRGDLFAQEFKDIQAQTVVVDGSQPTNQNSDNFYGQAIPVLQLMMAVLAIAMALGSGLALHDLKRCAVDSEADAESLAKQRRAVRQHMATLLAQSTNLSNEGAIFEARFQRDFYRSMLMHTVRKSLGKILIVAFCLLLPAIGIARAERPPLNLVIAIDLSASVASKGPDGKTDFAKNVAAVTQLLGTVPAGSRVTVIGITATSFAEPDILLSARIPADAGYFGERLAAAHRQLVQAWQERSGRLAPNARRTDILGALLLAGQILDAMPRHRRNVLVLYSDMRQATSALNLERRNGVPGRAALVKAERRSPVPALKDVQAYCVGVDAAARDASAWERLHDFWEGYFAAVGARLRSYTVLREAPSL